MATAAPAVKLVPLVAVDEVHYSSNGALKVAKPGDKLSVNEADAEFLKQSGSAKAPPADPA